MKITFYGYNAFVIESGAKRIAIDPGASFYLPDFFRTLIPKSTWNEITHIFVTHGDPDHHWHTDRVAAASGAKIICNDKMAREVDGRKRMLAPRNKGLIFNMPVKNLHTLSIGQTIALDGMLVSGIKGTHGSLTLKVGPFSKTLYEGPKERMGYGEMGFQIKLDGMTILNLGDTILHAEEWKSLESPDILMIPIGGKSSGNTMDEEDALKALQIIKPQIVIPVHYNCGALFNKCYNPVDDRVFKREVEEMGIRCIILQKGESLDSAESLIEDRQKLSSHNITTTQV
jgi:L-ascorbate metabolism protein UlaG (beta-lactamase superfamily)